MEKQPPPRAPTFPKFIDQEVDDADYLNTPKMNEDDGYNPVSYETPQPIRDGDFLNKASDHINSRGYHDDDDYDGGGPAATTTSTTSGQVPVVDLPVAAQRKSVIANILLWRNPKITGIYFGVTLVFFYLTLLRGQSVISVGGMIFAIYQFLGMIIVMVNKKMGGKLDKHIARPPPGTPLFRQEVANRWAAVVVEEGNDIQCTLRDIMYCDKPSIAIVCVMIGTILYWLGVYFSVLALLLVGNLLLFSLPLAYDKNKQKVDDTIAKASDTVQRQVVLGQRMASEKTAELLDKAPPAARQLAVKVGLTPKKKSS